MNDNIQNIDIALLTSFENHPFKLRDGEELEEFMVSIKKNKIIEPLIVRPFSLDGKYEVISGHRRLDALKRLGVKEAPVIIKDLTDEQAIMMMIGSNLKRENVLPSEKNYAYSENSIRMKQLCPNLGQRETVPLLLDSLALAKKLYKDISA